MTRDGRAARAGGDRGVPAHAWPGAAPVETHISLVFIGADTVWKLKKAVRLPFLDFTALDGAAPLRAARTGLNAPAAPGLYRDVVPVVRRPDGSLALGDGEPATVVDWVLRMARVPAAISSMPSPRAAA